VAISVAVIKTGNYLVATETSNTFLQLEELRHVSERTSMYISPSKPSLLKLYRLASSSIFQSACDSQVRNTGTCDLHFLSSKMSTGSSETHGVVSEPIFPMSSGRMPAIDALSRDLFVAIQPLKT
jgi:hypothetical protein